MSARIRILPEELCNRIAAGEVVERPASVIKELVENSLDAGATEIRLDLSAGGKQLIRVQDNGEGMGRDDVLLCLERHATSKISSDEDLFRLHTLGFRGEALPSIASVSRFTLRSCPAGAVEGWQIEAEGGRIRQAGAIGMARGTCVEVRDLFFNTPARRKFLRRDETELGHIGEVVTRLALAHPGVHFRLAHQERVVLEVFRHPGLAERAAAILGRPLLRDLLSLEAEESDGTRLHGLVSQPAANRSAGGWIYTFINGRFVRDRVFQHALMEGYRGCLEKGRYPVAVLFLEMPPESVDVNVHPTKHEVRFREQRRVHDFVAEAVRSRLRSAEWLEGDKISGEDRLSVKVPTVGAVSSPAAASPARIDEGEPVALAGRAGVREALTAYARRHFPEPPLPALPSTMPASSAAAQGELAVHCECSFFSSLAILGQFRRSYLLCQDGDDLLLIDQHAAHERIGFERLKAEFSRGGVERQALLFPVVVELGFREAALLAERGGDLERLGFEIEPFGTRAFAIKAAPHLLVDQAESLVRDVAAELAALGASGLVEDALDRILMLLACHGAIRANRDLTAPEIKSLLADLDGVDFKAHCPHGRPVMVRLTLAEVERMFRRI